MKAVTVVCIRLLILAALVNAPAHAQNPIPFQHIVLIIQENRTPDNLFGAGPPHPVCGIPDPFEPGVDIQNGGPNALYDPPQVTCLQSQRLATCWDIAHKNSTWNNQAHIVDGVPRMDKACTNAVYSEAQGCTVPPGCPQYSFVQKSDVQPYFDIATNYGFANYMFATNQGPSMPAHQFLLSGTSAPAVPDEPHGWGLDFVAENGNFGGGGIAGGSGCPATDNFPSWVDFTAGFLQPQLSSCYDHRTLVDSLENHDPKITWRYYAPTPDIIWTAPNGIRKLCYDPNKSQTGPCNSDYWTENMKFESTTDSVPVLTDITNCQLRQMSWVIPDERWSDHPGAGFETGAGPSYVANIVNAIGNSPCTDMIGNQSYTYWQDTAIFIVWDDWGGWYDHVKPSPIMRKGDGHSDCENAGDSWGCGYVYGFRVPLLVVSAYTPAGYVSGALPSPGMQPDYVHDFGSILRFTEVNFRLDYIANPNPYYADYNARDNGQHLGGDGNIPLSDFFQGSYRNFTNITPAAGFSTSFFTGYFSAHPGEVPIGPDGDDAD